MKNLAKIYIQPAFLICTAVLAIAGTGKKFTIEKLGVILKKEAIPLKKSFDFLDESAIEPYKVIKKSKIENKDVLEQLGTEQYLQWELEDTKAAPHSPVRYCSLFITYYTGDPDAVPHIPEECYVGGGSQRLGAESITLSLSHSGGIQNAPEQKDIDVRYVLFTRPSSDIFQPSSKYAVLYLFRVNGVYTAGRNDTRRIMSQNLIGKYSYFSKVEWKFYGGGFGGIIYPDKQEVIQASEKMLSVVLPVLEKAHWPDWKQTFVK